MKILLVFAGIAETGFNKTGKPIRLVWINHGLGSLASSVKKAGHDVRFLDLRQLSSWDEFKDAVKKVSPDVAGVTMMSVDYEPAALALRMIKESDRNIKTVVGGPHPTLVTEEVARDDKIDYIIRGEGEISFNNLLKNIESDRNEPRIIEGIRPDLDSLPFIDRDIFGAGEMPIDHFLPSLLFPSTSMSPPIST